MGLNASAQSEKGSPIGFLAGSVRKKPLFPWLPVLSVRPTF